MKNKIGIMCGRLSPPHGNKIQEFPVNSWSSEFPKAQSIGFEVLEWIFDLNKNPLMHDNGIDEIKTCVRKFGISIHAVCADYFMHKMLFNVSEFELEHNLQVLKNLITQCRKADIQILELPFVDSSSLKSAHDQNQVLTNLEKILPIAHDNSIIIALETDLPPEEFKNLLLKFNHSSVMANYDLGNSTANCFDTKSELNTLKDWITNIHVKDRIWKGKTVPLGTGNANFDVFFSTLNKINYKGDLIIQGAREDLVDPTILPEATCSKYFTFVKQYLDKYSSIINQ